MLLPLLLFFLAIFVAPVPALYRGEISGLEYLFSTLGRLLLFLGGILLLSHGWRRLEAEEPESSMFRLLLHIPVAGSLIREQQRLYYLQNLSLLLTAGLPAFTALETAALGVRHPALRERFAAAAEYCRGGMDVATALEHCGALEKPGEVSLAKSGEYSGQLDTMIRHQANLLEERLDRRYTLLTEWLPRFSYLLVLAYIVAG
jgi:type II secretory pathway component PulF